MSEWTFIRRVLIVLALLALAAALWVLSDILLMAFGAILVRVVLRSLSEPLVRATGLNPSLALALLVAAIVGILAGLVPVRAEIRRAGRISVRALSGAVTHSRRPSCSRSPSSSRLGDRRPDPRRAFS